MDSGTGAYAVEGFVPPLVGGEAESGGSGGGGDEVGYFLFEGEGVDERCYAVFNAE